ncbi:recombination-associated protein RdgC [Ralstonia sp.]|uniref:recombination-associated protein RdgC n=1 Tax=Ralstonia sp. TaxID=54061 RepID=UPI00257E1CA1|nr:recombination-associated protein RdgC [Ralstonia sp.]
MFKSFTAYRYAGPCAGRNVPFEPCGSLQAEASGFVRRDDEFAVVRIERKSVPAEALKRRVDELAAECEQQTGRKPGKKARQELKEQAYDELLPSVLPKRKDVPVLFLPSRGLVLIGSTSSGDTDVVTSLLIGTTDDLALSLLFTATPAVQAMSGWLIEYDPPAEFSIDRFCVLKAADESKSVVRYDKHSLDREDVRDHLREGKGVDALALSYRDRVSFRLTADLQFKSVELLGVTQEGKDMGADDAELFLWRAELGALLDALIAELGGVAQ